MREVRSGSWIYNRSGRGGFRPRYGDDGIGIAATKTWQQKLHTERFGFKNFRVLTVTATPTLLLPQAKKEFRKKGAVDVKTRSKMERRIGLLIEANKLATEGRGSGIFLFTDLPSLLVTGDVLTMPWMNGLEKIVRLVE